MAATEEPVNFRPVFCHRDDCDARRDRAYCSACGVDIAAYVSTVTGEQPAIAENLRAPEQPTITDELRTVEQRQIPVLVTQLPAIEPLSPADGGGNGGNGDHGALVADDEPSPAPRHRPWRHPLVVGAFLTSVAAGAGIGLLAGLA